MASQKQMTDPLHTLREKSEFVLHLFLYEMVDTKDAYWIDAYWIDALFNSKQTTLSLPGQTKQTKY